MSMAIRFSGPGVVASVVVKSVVVKCAVGTGVGMEDTGAGLGRGEGWFVDGPGVGLAEGSVVNVGTIVGDTEGNVLGQIEGLINNIHV